MQTNFAYPLIYLLSLLKQYQGVYIKKNQIEKWRNIRFYVIEKVFFSQPNANLK